MSTHEEERAAKVEAALEEALNVATHDHEDGTLWQAGHDAFYQDDHETLDEQLDHGLNAACVNDPDDTNYLAGKQAFHDYLGEEFFAEEESRHSGGLMDKLRSIPGRFTKKK